MSKEDFFNELSECLEGEVSVNEYRDSLSYYRDYFKEQEALGRSEQDILNELGSGRLIAHSIIDAHGLDNAGSHPKGYYDESGSYDAGYTDDDGEHYTGGRGDRRNRDIVNDRQSGPLSNFLGSAARVLIIAAVLMVVGLSLHVLLPVVLVLIAVIVFMGLIR